MAKAKSRVASEEDVEAMFTDFTAMQLEPILDRIERRRAAGERP